ncbi:Asp23/Gls24 family envelope stress response protein [Thermobrachium celere]|uniref:Alkaline shock protein n=1 Tax=Thermobrachium celere DSM 8682 TaxID=941824 RepID=R7RSI1_9CLOT|nr:Asp23/Gls24 family envelope stress response protein [Thermobrachium celere]GFR34265.1 alkaline-shock protein [Thermobrachium celere]CDF58210.1 Alkaline shock protein [Thermobrachium celere DSM 8682]
MADNTIYTNGIGEVLIAPEVVSIIASIAATEVKGVAGMYGGFTEEFVEKFGVKSSNKGIKVQINEDKEVVIDLNLIIEYGVRIPDVAFEVQQNVKRSVETMTGLRVVDVNIHVQGINMPKESKEEEKRNK